MSDAGSATGGTFFGLIVKPNKRYDTVVKEAFRVTKACLEPATAGDKVTSLYLEYDSEEFIIANLDKKTFNENLDLGFSLGEKLSFKVDGPGTVHVTGNIVEEEPPSFMGSMLDDSDEEEQDVSMETPDSNSGKRKGAEAKKDAKRLKLDSASTNGKADDEESSSEEESDESSDETGAETTTLSQLDSTSNFAEEEDSEEESDDDSGEDEEGEEEEEESDDDSGEEEEESDEEKAEVKRPAAKTNGDVSPSKKIKLEAKTPVKEQKKEDKAGKTPKQDSKPQKDGSKTPKQENKTPAKQDKTPKPEAKTPKPEAKTPKPEAKTPKQPDGKTPKPGKGDKTPKADKTPKPDKNGAKTPKADEAPKTPKDAKTPKGVDGKTPKPDGVTATPKSAKKSLKGGIQVEDLKIGSGPDVKPGKTVGMYYSGRLQTNNKQFDACQSGKPFKFKLGAGEVIKGWDVGIMGMKVGGKRKLTIPPNMAYGPRGAPPDIPPNSTLVFDIECKFAN